MSDGDKVRENRLRRMARRLGLTLRKSRTRHVHADDFGEYMLVDAERNAVAAGQRFDLSMDDVEEWLTNYEARLVAERSRRK